MTPACRNCDHFARYRESPVGFCVEPTSPLYHKRLRIYGFASIRESHHVLLDDCCFEWLEIPEQLGHDRRKPRDGVVDA